jgi:hypothetical protein
MSLNDGLAGLPRELVQEPLFVRRQQMQERLDSGSAKNHGPSRGRSRHSHIRFNALGRGKRETAPPLEIRLNRVPWPRIETCKIDLPEMPSISARSLWLASPLTFRHQQPDDGTELGTGFGQGTEKKNTGRPFLCLQPRTCSEQRSRAQSPALVKHPQRRLSTFA